MTAKRDEFSYKKNRFRNSTPTKSVQSTRSWVFDNNNNNHHRLYWQNEVSRTQFSTDYKKGNVLALRAEHSHMLPSVPTSRFRYSRCNDLRPTQGTIRCMLRKSHALPWPKYCADVMQQLLLSYMCLLNWTVCWDTGVRKTTVFSDVTSCRLAEKHQRFGGKIASKFIITVPNTRQLLDLRNFRMKQFLNK